MKLPIKDIGKRDYSTGSRTGGWPFGTLKYWRHLARERRVTCNILNRGLKNQQKLTEWYKDRAAVWERMPFLYRILWAFFPYRFHPGRLIKVNMSYKDVFKSNKINLY